MFKPSYPSISLFNKIKYTGDNILCPLSFQHFRIESYSNKLMSEFFYNPLREIIHLSVYGNAEIIQRLLSLSLQHLHVEGNYFCYFNYKIVEALFPSYLLHWVLSQLDMRKTRTPSVRYFCSSLNFTCVNMICEIQKNWCSSGPSTLSWLKAKRIKSGPIENRTRGYPLQTGRFTTRLWALSRAFVLLTFNSFVTLKVTVSVSRRTYVPLAPPT